MSKIKFAIRRGKKKRIIVVGAGLSGLTAAYQLQTAGHDVVVLEASNRIGGKAYTFRDPRMDPSLYAELGALVLRSDLPLPYDYADHFGVPYAPMPMPTVMLQMLGRKISNPTKATARWPVILSAKEKKAGAAGIWKDDVESIAATLGNPRTKSWPSKIVAPLDEMTFTEFLRCQGASPGAIEIMHRRTEDGWGDGFDVGSALQWLRELAYVTSRKTKGASQPPVGYFQHGTSSLADAFVSSLCAPIHTATPVSKIVESASGISAICDGPRGPEQFDGDKLICTVPFSVLRSISLPTLPRAKQRAIDLQQHTSVTRVYLQTSAPVWGKSLGNLTYTDQLPMFIYTANVLHTTTKGLLEVYISGRFARAVQSLAVPDRIPRVLDEVDAIAPGVKAAFEVGVEYSWDEQPWSRGAYPWYMPGDITGFVRHAATPVGRLHFAGEHTSLVPGWLHGAIESGERAAAEVA